jgi:hypothetical protein
MCQKAMPKLIGCEIDLQKVRADVEDILTLW